ncbi:uncharacterized protein LOC128223313 [Mya arenaria]|uniref:uncharacterized protein LOC128223313 n=1 Tax=Mya arenaria TaxID=6604 RepID=UPI0022E9573A|nr:uncharacterized protein LOC128223313 [Mya arenaria]
MFVMENDVESSFEIDVQQDEKENRRRVTSLHGEVPERMPPAIHIGHRRDYGTATGDVVSGYITSSDIDFHPPSNISDIASEALLETSSARMFQNRLVYSLKITIVKISWFLFILSGGFFEITKGTLPDIGFCHLRTLISQELLF